MRRGHRGTCGCALGHAGWWMPLAGLGLLVTGCLESQQTSTLDQRSAEQGTPVRQAVDEARGNVALAASRLGISRATVYRKLGLQRA